MNKIALVLTALAASVYLDGARADATLQFKVSTGNQSAPQVQTVYIKAGRFMVQAAGGDRNIDLLYDRGDDLMYVIDHRGKSYMTFDEKAVAQLGQAAAMIDAVRRQLAEQLKKMPPEQQARVREMLGGFEAPAPEAAGGTAPRKIKKLGSKSVNGIACQHLAIYRGEKKYSEMCVSEAGNVGLNEDDYKTIKALQDFQARLWTQASKISGQMGGHMPEFGGKDISGVPIEMKDFAGPVPTTMVVTKANSGVAGKALAVPKGYRAKALPSMGGAPGAMPGAMPK